MAHAALVGTLTDKFTSMLVDKMFQEVLLVTTFGDDFQSLCDELNTLKIALTEVELLKDVQEGRISSSMSNWLRKVEKVLIEAEYIVEECTDATNCKLRNPIFRYTMGNKIRGLNEKISNIGWSCKQFKNFESVLVINDRLKKSSKPEDKVPSMDRVTETYTVGMENDIREITDRVLRKGNPQTIANPQIIAIVGMGGSGKTLLLQHVFRNEKVIEEGFDYRVWLSVSHKFEYPSLLSEICKKVKLFYQDQDSGRKKSDESELKAAIEKHLKGKRCLFAIDDVWEDFVLENTGLTLSGENNIVITTRHPSVATSYGRNAYVHRLNPLSDPDSWKLFCYHAFPDTQNHSPPTEKLKEVAQKIKEKCCGVPLALKTVGRYMGTSGEMISKDWELTLKRLETEHLQSKAMRGIMPCLMLSYQALPYHLKPCFLYFSAFPKNTEIQAENLVYVWISEGFVSTSEDAYAVGHSYLNELIDRCLIEGSEFSGNGQVKSCKIHDFLHELADSIQQPTCFFKPGGKLVKLPVQQCQNVYRISLMKNDILEIKEAFRDQRIRTLLLSYNANLRSISTRFVKQLSYLSVLDLSMTSIKSLPKSIGKLNHLKFLNLSSTNIEKLPHSLKNLTRLLFLDVSNCNELKMLHPGIGKHQSMLHLNVENSNKLKCLPVGISKLVSLQTLKGVQLESKNAKALQIRHLKGLTLLEQLSLNVDSDQWTVNDPSASSEDIFGGMTKMRDLSFRNTSFNLLSLPESMNVMERLERVQLFKFQVPNWIYELQNLMELKLHGHHDLKIEGNKRLGNILNLRKLHLSQFTELFPQVFGPETAFPKLEELILELSDFSKFPWLKNDAMPKLKRLRLEQCANVEIGHCWQISKYGIFKVTLAPTAAETENWEVSQVIIN